jgi:Lectin C-type domain
MRAFACLLVMCGCGFQIDGAGSDVPVDGNGVSGSDASSVDASPGNDAGLAMCPSGYGAVAGIGRYRVVEGKDLKWDKAAEDCNDDDDSGTFVLHTHLLVLGSEVERLALTGTSTPISGNTWMGLSDRAVEGTFAWVTNEPTNGYPIVGQQPPWDASEPDNAGGEEDCVRFKNSYVLEDKPCDDEQSYVCECDAFAPN